VRYLHEQKITPIAYSSLIPLSTWRIAEGQDSAKTDSMREEALRDGFIFNELARRYQVSQAQILLRWALQEGYAVLPKSVNLQRIKQNIDLFNFSISHEDMELMNKLNKGDGVAWASGDPTQQGGKEGD
jgi:2,5-diketo-D-gluconate reductase A